MQNGAQGVKLQAGSKCEGARALKSRMVEQDGRGASYRECEPSGGELAGEASERMGGARTASMKSGLNHPEREPTAGRDRVGGRRGEQESKEGEGEWGCEKMREGTRGEAREKDCNDDLEW